MTKKFYAFELFDTEEEAALRGTPIAVYLADEPKADHIHTFADLHPDAPCQFGGCGVTRRQIRTHRDGGKHASSD